MSEKYDGELFLNLQRLSIEKPDFVEVFVDDDGDRWYIDQDGIQGLERLRDGPSTWNVDEYGDRSYMWDYM